MRTRLRKQSGFNLVELIITICIVAILASVSFNAMRDYTRRARMSEVILAASTCKTAVSEGYPTFDAAPPAGGWGCEGPSGNSQYTGHVQTSSEGVIRIAIANLDTNMNGHYVFLIPARSDGLTAMNTTTDIGTGVRSWICGSDLSFVRNALPANCRVDTTTYSTDTFGP